MLVFECIYITVKQFCRSFSAFPLFSKVVEASELSLVPIPFRQLYLAASLSLLLMSQ